MTNSKKIALVTGGTGYIGSHTCKAPSFAGYPSVTHDNLVYGHERAVNGGHSNVATSSTAARLDAVISDYKPEAAAHFAAFADVGANRLSIRVSFTATTCSARSRRLRKPATTESATLSLPAPAPSTGSPPGSHTGRFASGPDQSIRCSKQMVERMLSDFGAAHDIRFVASRYFNAAGADLNNETGESHDPETHRIPLSWTQYRAGCRL